MTNTINQQTRKKLGISSVHYLVMDVCSQYKNLLRPTDAKTIAEELGLTQKTITVAMTDLLKCEPRLLEQHETGSLYPSEYWYVSQLGEVEKVTEAGEGLAKQVVDYFNDVNQTRYQMPNNMELVKSIIKTNPRLTFDHFTSVIDHKRMTWGEDDKMKEYNRPSTLFRSSQKFMKYLDDANIFWITKAKLNGQQNARADRY